MSVSSRLDVELVRRGMARSRGQARDLIATGGVEVDGSPARKAAAPIAPDQRIAVADAKQWVSRSASKLVAALDAFRPQGLDVAGKRCLDVGASTGGFTEVLLDAGARHVVALDVGHDQLHVSLARHPQVTERSGLSIRDVEPDQIAGPAEVVVADLSFISLRLVLPKLVELTTAGGDLVLLVKPQFEVGRRRLGKAGVVRSEQDRRDVLLEVIDDARAAGLQIAGVISSPVRGTSGNAEFLLWCTRRAGTGLDAQHLAAAVRDAVEASGRERG